jgi:hypothetical protein
MIACFTISDVLGRYGTLPFHEVGNKGRETIVFFSFARIIFIWSSMAIGL